MPPTLITGAPGWLGTQLVHTLIEGLPIAGSTSTLGRASKIRCLVKPGEDASVLHRISENLEIVEADLRDKEAAAKFFRGASEATLFHCAGVVHPSRFVRELYDVNVAGTRSLLSAAQSAGIRRAVAISSNSPFGVSYQSDRLFDEDSPYRPYMNYGVSKMMMEQVVHEFQAEGRLETVILRPMWFYGPGQPQRQDTFFQMIRRGSAPILGDGNNRRSLTFIDNLCQALLLAASTPLAKGRTYWIADRRPYTMNEIVDTVERLMETEFGLKVAHRRMKLPFVVGEMAMLGDRIIQTVGLYQQKVHVLSEMNKTIACSIAKAEKELGYQPTIELEEGMRRSLAWCLDHGRIL